MGYLCAIEQRFHSAAATIAAAVEAPQHKTFARQLFCCTTVAAGWDDKIWHDQYQVCRYETKSATVQGEAWIAGHWQCSEYTVDADQSECTGWDWKAGHWVETFAEIQ